MASWRALVDSSERERRFAAEQEREREEVEHRVGRRRPRRVGARDEGGERARVRAALRRRARVQHERAELEEVGQQLDVRLLPAAATIGRETLLQREAEEEELDVVRHQAAAAGGEILPNGQIAMGTANADGMRRTPALKRYEYRRGKAIVFGSGFEHSTEPGAGHDGEVHAYLCFTFGTDDQERWPQIAETLDMQSRIMQQPCGELRLSALGRAIEAALVDAAEVLARLRAAVFVRARAAAAHASRPAATGL